MNEIKTQAIAAKAAAATLMTCSAKDKDYALLCIKNALLDNENTIIKANEIDIKNAKENGMSAALLDRLTLNPERIRGIADSIDVVINQSDPIGRVEKMEKRPNGLLIGKKTVPLGVIAIIYESRPNVTVDAAVLCLKAGNAVILRSGKEAFHSCLALTDIMRKAVAKAGLPEDSISFVQNTERSSVDELIGLTEYIDVIIPRGGAGLINHIVENSKIPIIETGIGICHVYVESSADLQMAADVTFNAKCRRVSVCNAAETLLVDRKIATDFLPKVKKLLDTKNTELRGCPETQKILGNDITLATDDDYYAEFLDYILAIKIVENIDEAIAHITKYGSKHSEAIITNDYTAANKFHDEIDAAAVYVNASTAFTDGGEFGLGAEIGISTQKMHARGPMGLEQLTSSKFIISGTGQTRQ